MKKILNSTNNSYVEISQSKEDKKAGRKKIRMSAHTIYDSEMEYNKNGISWNEQFTLDNIESAIGMPYVVDFIDEDKTIPSGHGEMSFDEDGNVSFEGETVGSVQKAYVDTVNIDGVPTKVLMTEGYIYTQRTPNFVRWLEEEISYNIKGSVEINGKGDATKIVYENGYFDAEGNVRMGRIPMIYDYTALAIMSDFVEPADDNSRILELNAKNGVSDKEKNEGGKTGMDFKKMYEELLEKYDALEKNLKEAELNSATEELSAKDTEISELNAKINEQSEIIVEANKKLEEANGNYTTLEAELNSIKEEYNVLKEEKIVAEINEYLEKEVSKNNFTKEEMNELNSFVENKDLAGLKAKESELCVLKFKEMANKKAEEKEESKEVEINHLFLNTKSEEKIDEEISTDDLFKY